MQHALGHRLWGLAPDTAIKFQENNPKQEGSRSAVRYEGYKTATTIAEALQLGACIGDLEDDKRMGHITFESGAPPPGVEDTKMVSVYIKRTGEALKVSFLNMAGAVAFAEYQCKASSKIGELLNHMTLEMGSIDDLYDGAQRVPKSNEIAGYSILTAGYNTLLQHLSFAIVAARRHSHRTAWILHGRGFYLIKCIALARRATSNKYWRLIAGLERSSAVHHVAIGCSATCLLRSAGLPGNARG